MSLADEWDSIAPAPAAASSGAAPAPAAGGSLADTWDSITPQATKAPPAPESRNPIDVALSLDKAAAQVVANQVTGIGAQIAGGYEGGWAALKTIAKGGSLEDAVNAGAAAVRDRQARGTYEPPAGSVAAQVTGALGSKYNPLNLPATAGAYAGEKVADVTGSPAAGAAVNTAINAIPLVLIRGGKAAPERVPMKDVGSGSIANEKPVYTPAQIAQGENLDIPTVIRRRAQATAQPAAAAEARPPLSLVPAEPGAGRPTVSAFDEPTPEAAAAKAEAAAPKFADSAPPAEAGIALPAAEQARRAAVLQRIGLEDARESAVTGNAKAASTDFQTSKLDNSAGTYMKSVLDSERAALTSHAEDIVRDTGGSIGTDEPSLLARGNAILAPLEGFKQWFSDKTNALYAAARERAGDQPVALDGFSSALKQDSSFAQSGAADLRKGIASRMKELGMADNEGQTLGNVQQAEALRQYINEQWTPQTNGLIRNLKQSLDDDVTSTAGADIFAQARQLHAMKQSIFADPKGLSSILDSEGINRKVPVEKIPDTIAALPNAQFAHVVKTLQTVPPEIQPAAQAALAEIKAQFANRMRDAGVGPNGQPVAGGSWRARDVTTYLNKNAAKMQLVFSPDEMASIRDLNDAGHILAKDTSYPGAAVQAHNLVQRGAIAALPKAGAAVGGTIGALFGAPGTGALVGETAGAGLAGKISESASLRATQKRVVKLRDIEK